MCMILLPNTRHNSSIVRSTSVSFEEDSQRARPGASLAALERRPYQRSPPTRPPSLSSNLLDQEPIQRSPTGPKLELESSSLFDGFCDLEPVSQCSGNRGPISKLGFNFLSTDFSHFMGVKGIPVRLCTKTELLLDSMFRLNNLPTKCVTAEPNFFRDHGAERKLSNDVAPREEDD